MEDDSEDDCSGSETSVKSNCCSDGHQNFIISDEFETQSELIQINPQFAVILLTSFFENSSYESEKFSHYLDYHPPRISEDIPVLIQSFLI